ncbi:hypothetical protein K2173_026227 [Erythroxylum novogranatense]|uniref:Myb/SANT-like DNA-binding domain-containing protein n=1 Tax=Erythroxylum novogranatense TaxID=1862640 RepID=A0AAV8SBM2_9ROSI|nr:hypothetical protein K2173_026227 [Erythroxylum novogranatense]
MSTPSPFNYVTKRGPPWTHLQTMHLIQATQWEEVAAAIPTRSATQCRNKMEKLRRRHRQEIRLVSTGGASSWPFFDLMDSLELGPFPISVPLLTMFPCTTNTFHDLHGANLEEDGEEDLKTHGYKPKSRSINYIIRKPGIVNRFASGEKRKRLEEKDDGEVLEEEEGGGGIAVEWRLAAEMTAFWERMAVVERRKMEMVKETERWRLEMEMKRRKMIRDSQNIVVDIIASVFGTSFK